MQIAAECWTYSGRTAGAQSVLEDAAQTLSRYKDGLRTTRMKIIDEVAAGSSRSLVFDDYESLGPPPAYYASEDEPEAAVTPFDLRHARSLKKIQASIGNKSCMDNPSPGTFEHLTSIYSSRWMICDNC